MGQYGIFKVESIPTIFDFITSNSPVNSESKREHCMIKYLSQMNYKPGSVI